MPTTSLVDETTILVYGIQNNKEETIKFSLSENDSTMSKTAFAQPAYNDYKMQEQFELKDYVYVLNSFNVV
jgi:hypothetical protein